MRRGHLILYMRTKSFSQKNDATSNALMSELWSSSSSKIRLSLSLILKDIEWMAQTKAG